MENSVPGLFMGHDQAGFMPIIARAGRPKMVAHAIARRHRSARARN